MSTFAGFIAGNVMAFGDPASGLLFFVLGGLWEWGLVRSGNDHE